METEIGKLLVEQIKCQTRLPSKQDIVPYSALFESDECGHFTYTAGDNASTEKLEITQTILDYLSVPNVKFLFLTRDYSDPTHYKDNANFSFCFGKLRSQPFITIPNAHLLNGWCDMLLSQVREQDCDFSKKFYMSIFVGGPNCSINEPRSRYTFSGLNQQEHMCVITTEKIFPIQQQLRRLFVVTIDGHSLCYDRLYWQMASNSVPVYIERRKDIIQLHDNFILPNVHYLDSTVEEWPKLFEEMKNQQDYLKNIAQNGIDFINKHFGNNAQEESIRILEFCLKECSKKQSAM